MLQTPYASSPNCHFPLSVLFQHYRGKCVSCCIVRVSIRNVTPRYPTYTTWNALFAVFVFLPSEIVVTRM